MSKFTDFRILGYISGSYGSGYQLVSFTLLIDYFLSKIMTGKM